MSRYRPEPKPSSTPAASSAVLLVNLGTPEAPTKPAVRRYLREFLSDPRVVEIPPVLWKPILHGIVLNTRPASSAAKYAKIWTRDGSPLKVHTEGQAKLLRGWLGEKGRTDIHVAYAMRYGTPSIASALDACKAAGAARILILPLFPQYSGSATGSVFDAVADWGRGTRALPELRFIPGFHASADYISALAATVRDYWLKNGRGEKLLMSFHGLPERSVKLGDPYFGQCQQTGRLLAEELGLRDADYVISFQSRFGRAQWLQPYTQATLEKLARAGTKRIDVICPGFVADCLETLEEIALEGKGAFLAAGGKDFHYIPCLNERGDWIAALGGWVVEALG